MSHTAQPFHITTAGAEPARTIDEQITKLDAMLLSYHAEKIARPVPSISAERALDDLIADLPPVAPPLPLPRQVVSLGSPFARRREIFGAFGG